IQAAGAAPFADYFASGFDRYRPVVAETVATAIKIGNPPSVERARRAIQLTHGVVTTGTPDEILDAKAQTHPGAIGREPASAASRAGGRRLVREGLIAADATVVGILTGHVLRDADAVVPSPPQDRGGQPRPGANRPVTIPADQAALERTLADALHG